MDPGEDVGVAVLKRQSRSVITISRGIEDGIEKGDHVQFHSEKGFRARGIALKTDLSLSHWKLYRIYNDKVLSQDDPMRIFVLPQDQIPPDIKKQIDKVKIKEAIVEVPKVKPFFEDRKENEKTEQLKDFPAYRIGRREYKHRLELEKTRPQISYQQLKKDLADRQIGLRLSPIQLKSQNKYNNINGEVNLYTAGDKFALDANYNLAQESLTNQLGQEYKNEHQKGSVDFEILNIKPRLSYLLHFSFEKEKNEVFSPLKNKLRLGIIGFRYDIKSTDNRLKEMSFSYQPLYENKNMEALETENCSTGESICSTEKTKTNFRHFFTFNLIQELSNAIELREKLSFGPLHDFTSSTVDFYNMDLENKFEWRYRLSNRFYFSYENLYSWNTERKDLGLASSRMEHKLIIGADFNL